MAPEQTPGIGRKSGAQAPFLVMAAMAIMGGVDALVPRIAEQSGLFQFHLLRAAMVLPMIGILAWKMRISLLPRSNGAVFARSCAVGLSMMIYFGALAVFPVSEVVAGLFTAPIFVLLLTWALPGERVGPGAFVGIALGFVGLLIVLQPGAADRSPWVVVPVAAGAAYAVGALLTRRVCAQEHVLTLVFWFFGLMFVSSAVGLVLLEVVPGLSAETFALRPWNPAPEPVFYLYCTLQAVGSLAGVGLLTQAYKVGSTPVVAGFEYSFMIFAAVWAWLLLGQIPAPHALAGMALILVSGIVILRFGTAGVGKSLLDANRP